MINAAQVRRAWRAVFGRLDGMLLATIVLLLGFGLTVLFSATYDTPARFYDQLRNIAVATLVMWVAAQVPPQTLMRIALPIYTVGVALLIAVAMFGAVRKGARGFVSGTLASARSFLAATAGARCRVWIQSRCGRVMALIVVVQLVFTT